MISALQQSRPQAHPPRPTHPLNQHQIRRIQQTESPKEKAPTSQVEAMPPHEAQLVSPNPHPTPVPVYNPATRHPVFFTDGWRRPPFPMPFHAGFSPVATGYVFGDNKKRAQSMTKL